MSEQTTPSFGPLSPRVRELLSQILGAGTDHGAPQLRAQLALAQEARCEHGWIDFRVRADAPRICGPNYDFPVALRGDDDGAPVWAVLRIENGCLAELELLREGLLWHEGMARLDELDLAPTEWP